MQHQQDRRLQAGAVDCGNRHIPKVHSMTSRASKAALVVAVAAIAAYWYWSPYLTVRQLQSAAQNKDADAFNRHVDYPKLRESLKGQFSGMFADQMGRQDNDLARAGSVVGTLIGMAVVSPFVDAIVRPETIMRAMQDGHLSPKGETRGEPKTALDAPANPAAQKDEAPRKPKWTYRRAGVNQVIAYANDVRQPDQPDEDKLALVLQRSGFANWKLSDVRLPALNK
jgi:hypothetical protein